MSFVEINWHPDHKELRNFAIIALVASAIISLGLYWLKGIGIQWTAIIISIGFIIFLSSFISVTITKVVYLSLTLIALPIGWVISFLLLSAFYFLLLTPLGLLFRLMGRDPLHRKFDSTANSYWVSRHPPDSLERYFHQF